MYKLVVTCVFLLAQRKSVDTTTNTLVDQKSIPEILIFTNDSVSVTVKIF